VKPAVRKHKEFFDMGNNLNLAGRINLLIVLFILSGSVALVRAQPGGGGVAGGSANVSSTMKLPARKTTRNTTPKPRTGPQPRTPDNSAQVEDALALADDERQAGRTEAAERGYLLAAKMAPNDPRPYVGLGHLYYNEKKFPDAEKYYAHAATLARGDSEPYARLAFTYSEMKRLPDALAAARRAVTAQPDNYYGYLALGYVLSLQQNYTEAESAYRKSVSLTPQPLLVLHAELVRILSAQRRYADALTEAKKEVDIDPKNFSARFDYAIMLQKLGRLAPSAAQYLEAIKLSPKGGAAHSNVGLIYYMTENFAAAREHWSSAISLGSTYDPDRIGLMILDGRLADARRELEAYTQKAPDDEDGWLMLGDVYRALGEESRARVTDARAAQIAPEYVGLRRPNLRALLSSSRGPESANNSSTSGVQIERAYMARSYPAASTDVTNRFVPGERTVHCIIELNQARTGTLVRFVWKTVQIADSQNEVIKTVDYTTRAGESEVHGNLTLPRDWPRGTYKTEVYLNNTLAKTVNWSVE
jgi:Flp pilus assembly protein TadD